MRLSLRLVQVASILMLPACSSSVGGNCGPPPGPSSRAITATQACDLLQAQGQYGRPASGGPCLQLCPGFNVCTLPDSYLDASPGPDATIDDAGIECPAVDAAVTITCSDICTGRLTDGYAGLGAGPRSTDWGERFASMAYLEAVAVFSFERLERELTSHGAPPSLLRDVRRARRDEVRHARMTARMARRAGKTVRVPERRELPDARSLVRIAVENAVEGCVRETYGALQGLLDARTARTTPESQRAVRRTMASIAADECRHAELAWDIHRWAMARLAQDDRRMVEEAMREARAEISARDPRAAALLFS